MPQLKAKKVLKFIKKTIKFILPHGLIVYREKQKTKKEHLKAMEIMRKSRLVKRNLLRFEVHLTEHCNLGCVSCSHFSSIAPKTFIDVQEYERDCQRLSVLTGAHVEDVSLCGGEPLLHPDIIKIMEISRKCFPHDLIRIITNGTLLLRQSENFWMNCNKNNIHIYVSVYPLKLNYAEMENTAERYGVNMVFWGDPSSEYREWVKLPIDLKGGQNPAVQAELCYWGSNYCVQLRKGRLYKCWRIAYIDFFNKAFNTHLEPSEADYIDIYKENNINQILEKLARPAPFCRYCNMKKARVIPWERTKKDISEWL